MALYAAELLLSTSALLRLRYTEPELRRPYRIPLSRRVLCLAYAPQLLLCICIIAYSLRTLLGAVLWCGTVVIGLALPRLGRRCFAPPAPRASPSASRRFDVHSEGRTDDSSASSRTAMLSLAHGAHDS